MLPYQLDNDTKFCLLSDILGDCLVMPIASGKNNFELKKNKDNTIKQYKKAINGAMSSRQIVVMLYLGDMTDFTGMQIWNDIVYPELERQNSAKNTANITLPVASAESPNKANLDQIKGNEQVCPNCNGVVGDWQSNCLHCELSLSGNEQIVDCSHDTCYTVTANDTTYCVFCGKEHNRNFIADRIDVTAIKKHELTLDAVKQLQQDNKITSLIQYDLLIDLMLELQEKLKPIVIFNLIKPIEF